MSKVSAPEAAATAATPTAQLSDAERLELLAAEIEKHEKLASSQIEMAELFLAQGKDEIARRRLEQILSEWPEASSAETAKTMLKKLAKKK